ncbi:lysozyme [Streptomyces varsoviensis]|uniref:lysozyme n=1 Tax=Streptomyces varsoviensis TaxID=67373 RepID=UPI0033FEF54C
MDHDNHPARRRGRLIAASASAAALALGAAVLAESTPAAAWTRPHGHDVSSHQKKVAWSAVRAEGASFVYVKATEATNYRNPYFTQQYNGSRKAGLLRGAYHFAVPSHSSGRAQAAYFLRNGGAWRADGWTLPPALDIEGNPYGKRKCYGLNRTEMVRWIASFSGEVRRRTGRRPVIYTTTRWWNGCTGGSRAFGANHPLWLASWHGSPGPMPAGWSFATFWQHANRGLLPGDQDVFNGTMKGLRRLAAG